jgi:hypothetical protein
MWVFLDLSPTLIRAKRNTETKMSYLLIKTGFRFTLRSSSPGAGLLLLEVNLCPPSEYLLASAFKGTVARVGFLLILSFLG